eukprot:1156620-Pelagomonas_calceolata.AAC.2
MLEEMCDSSPGLTLCNAYPYGITAACMETEPWPNRTFTQLTPSAISLPHSQKWLQNRHWASQSNPGYYANRNRHCSSYIRKPCKLRTYTQLYLGLGIVDGHTLEVQL